MSTLTSNHRIESLTMAMANPRLQLQRNQYGLTGPGFLIDPGFGEGCQIGCPKSSLGGLTTGGCLDRCTEGCFRFVSEMDICRFSVHLEQF
jgi:hypothetical protein